MEDQLRDKGEEILSLEARISSLTTDNSNNKTIEQLRKSLQEKTKQYDRYVVPHFNPNLHTYPKELIYIY